MSDEPASRREVDILRDELHRLDDHGSRGVGAIQAQLTEVVKDLSELKAETANWQAAHARQHDTDQQQRQEGRRWLITTAIAAIVMLVTVIALLAEVLRTVR